MTHQVLILKIFYYDYYPQELFTKIDEHISGMVSNSSVILNFGHSSGLKPILTALEMFKDEDPLLVSLQRDNLSPHLNPY